MSSPGERIFERAQELLGSVQSIEELLSLTGKIVRELLQRSEDQDLRDKTLAYARGYYSAKLKKGGDAKLMIQEAREFSVEVAALIIRARRKRGEPQPRPVEIKTFFSGIEAQAPPPVPVSDRASAPTSIIVVPPPPAETHDSFDRLLSAALRHRIGVVSTFFHRWNPRVFRDMPLPFLMAVPFGAHLDQVIDELIVPGMLRSRAIRHLEHRYGWEGKDTETFWQIVESGHHMDAIRRTWHAVWKEFHPEQVSRKTGEGTRTMLRIGAGLKRMREIFTCDNYAIPVIGSRDIDLFASFIDPEYARPALENAWTKLRQTYEQEMDLRVYQDQARRGALRDALLACFEPFTNPTAEFLAMLSYWNFPQLSLSFLVAFTHNHGSNRAARLRRIPYLMWYLDLPGAEKAMVADDLRIAKAAEAVAEKMRADREREEQEAKERQIGTAWR